jgi:hypothetical protein
MAAALTDAMLEWLEFGELCRAEPAILQNHAGHYCYSDAATAAEFGGTVLHELRRGFGAWTPETEDDVRLCAVFLAEEIEEALATARA